MDGVTKLAEACPCGTEKDYEECCRPFIEGRALPPTAEALMRSRYSSYVKGRVDYIERTHAPDGGADFDRKAAEKWARESEWRGLEIRAVKGGGEADAEGVVSFAARFASGGREYRHEEIASFRRDGRRWLFVDGRSPKPETFVKSGPDLGRNDPCHCGSGRKLKKCHGRAAA